MKKDKELIKLEALILLLKNTRSLPDRLEIEEVISEVEKDVDRQKYTLEQIKEGVDILVSHSDIHIEIIKIVFNSLEEK